MRFARTVVSTLTLAFLASCASGSSSDGTTVNESPGRSNATYEITLQVDSKIVQVVRAADNGDFEWIEVDTKATSLSPAYVVHYIWEGGRLFGPTEDTDDASRLSVVTPGETLAFLSAPALGEFTAARLVAALEDAHRDAPDPAIGKFVYRAFDSPESVAERGPDSVIEFSGTMRLDSLHRAAKVELRAAVREEALKYTIEVHYPALPTVTTTVPSPALPKPRSVRQALSAVIGRHPRDRSRTDQARRIRGRSRRFGAMRIT